VRGVKTRRVAKRLFIAVDIDDATRQQVSRVSAGVREAVGQVRASWVHVERMHLTLHFLGGADAALEQRARDGMARPFSESAFDVTFERLGCFPERGSPRVLWLGIRDGLEPLRRIQRVLAEQLQLRPDHQGPFTPHLTLARLKDRIPRGKHAKIGEIPAFAGPSRIDRVTLYESRLSPMGPTYIPLAEAFLRT
jgi:2'-5' RNA ligase